jgi:hypothetical protein
MKGYWLILGTEITDQAAQNDYSGYGHRSRRNTRRVKIPQRFRCC